MLPSNASGRPLGVGTAAARVPCPELSLGARGGHCSQGLRPKPSRGWEGGPAATLFSKGRLRPRSQALTAAPPRETTSSRPSGRSGGAAVPCRFQEGASRRPEAPTAEGGSGKTDVSWAALPIAGRALGRRRSQLSLAGSPGLGRASRCRKLIDKYLRAE